MNAEQFSIIKNGKVLLQRLSSQVIFVGHGYLCIDVSLGINFTESNGFVHFKVYSPKLYKGSNYPYVSISKDDLKQFTNNTKPLYHVEVGSFYISNIIVKVDDIGETILQEI